MPVSKESGTTGFDYGDYLIMLLAMENKNSKVMRAMDVIEMNMRTKNGNKGFRMDGCIDYAEAEVSLGARGFNFSIIRDYSYEAIVE